MEDYRFSIEVFLSQTPTEQQKTFLMVELDRAIEKALGKPRSGTIVIHSPFAQEESMQNTP